MPFAWGEAKPSDSDIVSQHPADERATRLVVKNFANVEHDQAEGRHKFGIGNTAARDAITTWVDGSVWFNTTDVRNRLNLRSGAAWVQGGQEFQGGSVVSIVFRLVAAPLGWTQQVDLDDRMLRITSSTGGAVAGAWPISGLSTVNDGHVHGVSGTTAAETQDHYHGVSGNTGGPNTSFLQENKPTPALTFTGDHFHSMSFNSGGKSATHDHTLSFNSGAPSVGHSHSGDGTWRPAYLNVISATKD